MRDVHRSIAAGRARAVACDGSGIARFSRIRYRSYDATVFLYAFDLIELNGDDLRRFNAGQGWTRRPLQ